MEEGKFLNDVARDLHKLGYSAVAIVGVKNSGAVAKVEHACYYTRELRFVLALVEGLAFIAKKVQKIHGFISK